MAEPDAPPGLARDDGALEAVLGAAALQMADMRQAGDRVQDLVSVLVTGGGATLDHEAIVGLQGLDSLVQRLSLLADLFRELELALAGTVIADPGRRGAVQSILVRLEGAAAPRTPDDADEDTLWAHAAP
ncbi:MAG: hypothetical protein ACOY4K_08475 [Pseudomonadota bacterium]